MIRESLAAHRVTASRDATQYLVEHLGGDRLLTRSELDKLALYAGEGGRVELEDAVLSVGDSAALELDDAVMAAAEGDTARLDRVLGRVFQEGESPVTVVRAMLRHLQRLHALAATRSRRAAAGEDAAQRPPADLLQAPGQLQPPARAVARTAPAAGARPPRPSRNRHEDHRPSRRNPVPAGNARPVAQAARSLA